MIKPDMIAYDPTHRRVIRPTFYVPPYVFRNILNTYENFKILRLTSAKVVF